MTTNEPPSPVFRRAETAVAVWPRHCNTRGLVMVLTIAAFLLLTAFATLASGETIRVYIGTYTRGDSQGIYLLDLDLKTSKLTKRSLVAETENPSFIALHPSGNFLYAVNEVGQIDGEKSGGVSAFRIDAKSGKLQLLNQQLSLGGAPCHLVVDKAGKNVLVANYSGGSVACLPIDKTGRLAKASSFIQHKGSSVDPRRQKGPHAHSINLDAANRFAFAADLGLDKVLIYRFNPDRGKLTANDPPFVKVKSGAGPRHFDFHPNGKFAYVINEMDLTVTAFRYDAQTGELTTLQTISTLPGKVQKGFSTAEVQVHPSGKFLYGSNRGHDSIAVFAIDQKTGKLGVVEHESTGGRTPRNFGIDPSGQFLLAANQTTNDVVVFQIDQQTGALSPTGTKADVPSPVCVKFAR